MLRRVAAIFAGRARKVYGGVAAVERGTRTAALPFVENRDIAVAAKRAIAREAERLLAETDWVPEPLRTAGIADLAGGPDGALVDALDEGAERILGRLRWRLDRIAETWPEAARADDPIGEIQRRLSVAPPPGGFTAGAAALFAAVEQVEGAEVVEMGTSEDRRNYRVDFSKIQRVLNFEPQWSLAQGIAQVKEAVMSGQPRTVGPETLLAKALEIQESLKITALIVVEDGRPIGLVHYHDLLRSGVA